MTTTDLSTRDRLLQAGAALFLQQGFEATSLDQVRQLAQASNGSLYHHFPSKAHLARALYLQALADYQAHVAPALDGDPPAAEGVRALVTRHIAWLLKQPLAARVLVDLRGATRIDGVAPDWQAVNAQAFGRLQRWIDHETGAGRMLAMPFGTWLALVLAPVMQLAEGWLRLPRPQVPAAQRELLAAAAARAVTPAALPSPSPSPPPRRKPR